MTRVIHASVGCAMLLAGLSHADVVVPNVLANAEGDGTFSLTSTGTAGRTFQLTMAAGQLTGLVGQQISGMQFRLNGTATAAWPAANVSYASWDIFVGPGVAPSSMSNTFASNFSGPATQVRSGGLAFSAGAFTFGASPNAFGPAIAFNTPYLYSGGDLTIEMRFSAQVGSTTQSPFDAQAASGGPGNGWGVDFAGRWTSNAAGVTGSNANFLATNLVAVPAPASLALLAATMGLASRRKRQ